MVKNSTEKDEIGRNRDIYTEVEEKAINVPDPENQRIPKPGTGTIKAKWTWKSQLGLGTHSEFSTVKVWYEKYKTPKKVNITSFRTQILEGLAWPTGNFV